MSKWSGLYNDIKESKEPLEKDIERAMEGKSVYETSTGGTVRESDDRIDVYGKSDSPKGHSHDWYNSNTRERGHHD